MEAAGFGVRVPEGAFCCGRPLYDYGMLQLAGRLLTRLLDSLESEITAGMPVVVLEPSCAAVFRDELVNMLPDDQHARRLGGQTLLLSELLVRRAGGWEPPPLRRRALVQRHCHHHAVMKFSAERKLLHRLGLDFRELEHGCCGLAGSFGYERRHYDLSMAVAERGLLPELRGADADVLLLADGFSCQEQIAHGTGRRPLHLAEALREALREAERR